MSEQLIDQPTEPDAVVIDAELVTSILEQVWDSLLRAPVLAWEGPAPVTDADALRAEVALRGGWNGRVAVACARPVARWIAGQMLEEPPHVELGEDEVRDALGELVNVVGGNLKGALSGETTMGLPLVGDGASTEREPGTRDGPLTCDQWVVDLLGSPVVVEVRTHHGAPTR